MSNENILHRLRSRGVANEHQPPHRDTRKQGQRSEAGNPGIVSPKDDDFTLVKQSAIDPKGPGDNFDQHQHTSDEGLDTENINKNVTTPGHSDIVQSDPVLTVDRSYSTFDNTSQRHSDPCKQSLSMGCNTQREVSSSYRGHFESLFNQNQRAPVPEQAYRVKRYKDLLLPHTMFKPTPRWSTPTRTPRLISPENIPEDDLSYYLGTVRKVCHCYDRALPQCPFHGRGNATLKRWTNDLLKAQAYLKHGVVLSESQLFEISMTQATSTPSVKGSMTTVSEQFSQEKEISVIESHDEHGVVKRRIKHELRKTLKTEMERGDDSGLKTNHNPLPPDDHQMASGGGVPLDHDKIAYNYAQLMEERLQKARQRRSDLYDNGKPKHTDLPQPVFNEQTEDTVKKPSGAVKTERVTPRDQIPLVPTKVFSLGKEQIMRGLKMEPEPSRQQRRHSDKPTRHDNIVQQPSQPIQTHRKKAPPKPIQADPENVATKQHGAGVAQTTPGSDKSDTRRLSHNVHLSQSQADKGGLNKYPGLVPWILANNLIVLNVKGITERLAVGEAVQRGN